MNIHWLPEAREDIARLHAFLVARSPAAALRAVRVIRGGASALAVHPSAGRRMDDDTGRREFILPFGAGAYVLRYRLLDEAVIIIRVWHSRETRL